jgi:D-alanyl-lipoteichoic acid acyltransferase DltB (MBOAT superfamily)
VLFNSVPFIFGFLPIALILFFSLARWSQTLAAGWLTAVSLFFYGWWDYNFVGLLLASVVFNYVMGFTVARTMAAGSSRRGRRVLAFAITVNLIVLAYYKYANFFLESFSSLVDTRWSIAGLILPLGISFFTFTQIAFLVDVYRRRVTSYHFIHYALFVTYFPHLIAGPILHHKDMIEQFTRPSTYRLAGQNIAVGLTIFSIGLFKKIVIADTVAMFSRPAFAAAAQGDALSFVAAWGGVLAYTFQLYFDFSGYSDMAIGISRLFGIHLPLNFNSPYKAESIIDFWRRWHMTLSRFLRDYLYVPLGGGRQRPARRYANLLITMLLGGLWHGAGWTFVVWGALHGIYLVINHGWRAARRALGHELPSGATWSRHASRAVTFLAVVIGWVFFRSTTLEEALRMLKGMAGLTGFATPKYFADAVASIGIIRIMSDLDLPTPTAGVLFVILSILLTIVWVAPNTQQLMGAYSCALDPYPDASARRPPDSLRWRPVPLVAMAVAVLFSLSLLGLFTETPSEFLYFQF